MKNKTVGIIIISISILIGFIIYSFNNALKKIVSTSCTHGSSCPMWGTINFETNISIGVMIFVIIIGIYLIFFGKEEKITIKQMVEPKKFSKEDYKDMLDKLQDTEKIVFEKILESEGTIFQSDLVDKTSLSKVTVTRILDKLEGRNIIERKRRGMTNVVILKHK